MLVAAGSEQVQRSRDVANELQEPKDRLYLCSRVV
jgi:hypothetical protein